MGKIAEEEDGRVSMVRSVTSRPPLDGPLHGSTSEDGHGVLQGLFGDVRSVRPESMVAGRLQAKGKCQSLFRLEIRRGGMHNRHSGKKVVADAPEERLFVVRRGGDAV
jgi:hypothetical protein